MTPEATGGGAGVVVGSATTGAGVSVAAAPEAKPAKAAETVPPPVVIHGSAGGAFSINGPGLGTGGTLTVGGQAIPTPRWEDRTIRGVMPPDAQGEVVLTTPNGVRRGTFPYVSPPVKK